MAKSDEPVLVVPEHTLFVNIKRTVNVAVKITGTPDHIEEVVNLMSKDNYDVASHHTAYVYREDGSQIPLNVVDCEFEDMVVTVAEITDENGKVLVEASQ